MILASLLFAAAAVSASSQQKDSSSRLIEFAPGVSKWLQREDVENLQRMDVSFMDITNFQNLNESPAPASTGIPSALKHRLQDSILIDQLDINNVKNNLITLSSFYTRYYTSSTGLESAQWVFDTVSKIANNRTDVTVTKFQHSWPQFSTIARIEGTTGSKDIVILGSHQDSINVLNPSNGRAPGADDDGSGTVSVMEIFRVFVESGFRPENPIEFHFYAAEESGLLGSQDIATRYKSQGASIRSMMQLDMVGYNGKESVVGTVTDFTDPETVAFVRMITDNFLSIPWVNTVCGYGCSDHASWTKAGYRSCFPFESQFKNISPYIHTSQDTVENMSFEHAYEFLKLGVVFVTELSFL